MKTLYQFTVREFTHRMHRGRNGNEFVPSPVFVPVTEKEEAFWSRDPLHRECARFRVQKAEAAV